VAFVLQQGCVGTQLAPVVERNLIMRLKDIMTTTVETVRPGETLERAQARMRLRRLHHLVVIDHRQIVGMLTDAALQVRQAEGVARVEDAMSRHVVTGTPEMTVRQAANLMRGRAEGALPVLAGPRLVGIVTVTDLLDLLGRGVDRPAPKRRATLRDRGLKPRSALRAARRD
jgi:CBS domain-containing protein